MDPPSQQADPDAQFSSRGWALRDLLVSGGNFKTVPRVSIKLGFKQLIERVREHEKTGVPLIIEDCHRHCDWTETFNFEWFFKHGPQEVTVRNMHDMSERSMPLVEFIAKARTQEPYVVRSETERFYGKDLPCPREWEKWLQQLDVFPPFLLPTSSENLLMNRPASSEVVHLMCYLGSGDTYTSCHKDLCASSGQNLMCWTEEGASSFWFMTASSSAPAMSKYFHELRQELDHETHFITVEQLKNAPCEIYITEQKLGDLVLVPPRSCHQVVNHGGMTLKTSWSRLTSAGLSTALFHELPIYRRVCRPEIYRVKSTIYFTLKRLSDELIQCLPSTQPKAQPKDKQDLLAQMLSLFDHILVEEYSKNHDLMRHVSRSSPGELHFSITCDFCGADIFQSFFECICCTSKKAGDNVDVGDGYVVCPGCYAEGRSCRCVTMEPVQCFPFDNLLDCRQQAVDLLERYCGQEDRSITPQAELFTSTSFSVFEAGCILLEMRKKAKKESRICQGISGTKNHEIKYDWGVPCKKCHSLRCFQHSLHVNRLHSVDILLPLALDATHARYHQQHQRAKQRYLEGCKSFEDTWGQGSLADTHLQAVYLASRFTTCKPINPTFMSFGWYDHSTQIIPVDDDISDELQLLETTQSTTSEQPDSSDHDFFQVASSSSCTLDESPPTSSIRKRKRLVLECVEILRKPSTARSRQQDDVKNTRSGTIYNDPGTRRGKRRKTAVLEKSRVTRRMLSKEPPTPTIPAELGRLNPRLMTVTALDTSQQSSASISPPPPPPPYNPLPQLLEEQSRQREKLAQLKFTRLGADDYSHLSSLQQGATPSTPDATQVALSGCLNAMISHLNHMKGQMENLKSVIQNQGQTDGSAPPGVVIRYWDVMSNGGNHPHAFPTTFDHSFPFQQSPHFGPGMGQHYGPWNPYPFQMPFNPYPHAGYPHDNRRIPTGPRNHRYRSNYNRNAYFS